MSEVVGSGLLAAVFLGQIQSWPALVGGSIILTAAAGVVIDANSQASQRE